MFRLLATSWLARRLAIPLGRAIPNPILRAAAMAGASVVAARLLQKRSGKTSRPHAGAPAR